MPFIAWNDRLSVHVPLIDGDHKRLVGMLNDLYDAIAAGHGREVIGGLLDRLVEYTQFHFEREEKLMEEVGYPGRGEHAGLHAGMVAWAREMQSRHRSGATAGLSLEAVSYLKDWLFDHILTADQAVAPWVAKKVVA